MKRTPDIQPAGDELPAFLADEANANAATTEAESAAADDTTEPAVDDSSAASADTEGAETPATRPSSGDEPAAAAAPMPPAPSRRQRQKPKVGGKLAMFSGGLLLAGGLAMSLLPEVAAKAANYGVQPNLPFVVGTLLFAAGAMQRHIGRLQHRLDEAENRRQLDADAMHQNLQQLVAGSTDKAPGQGDDLQHMLMALQRQDEKINNLTKAIKMYGKPLMEISGQGTELAGGMANLKALVEGGVESNRQGLSRIESQLRAPQNQKEFTELGGTVQKLMARIEALASQKASVDLAPLQQQIGRLEVTVAAVAQRLEDNEVRKSLLRLEEASHKERDVLQELLRGDSVQKATAQLQARVDSATKGLNDGLAQLREGNLNGLETAVRDIQREVAGVATTVAQINAAVKGGVRVANATSAPAVATPEPVAMAATAAPAPAAAATPAADGGAYSTGSRSSGGKNVLGAIAKLKQMKG
ncbi:MAG: hypothetical protein JNK15_03305 [Planctomycetes bacterium]|nr:hypothetical protein [Planctomycetota bacterium]